MRIDAKIMRVLLVLALLVGLFPASVVYAAGKQSTASHTSGDYSLDLQADATIDAQADAQSLNASEQEESPFVGLASQSSSDLNSSNTSFAAPENTDVSAASNTSGIVSDVSDITALDSTTLTSTDSDDNEPLQVKSIDIYYSYVDKGSDIESQKTLYNSDDSETYPVVWKGRTVKFSATVNLTDGTSDITKIISEEDDGSQWTWRVEKSFDAAGEQIASPAVEFSEINNLTSLTTSGSAEVTFVLHQFSSYVAPVLKINVSETPADKVYLESASLSYTDATHTNETAYNKSDLPTISSQGATVRFYVTLHYSDGTATKVSSIASQNNPRCSWSVDSVTDWQDDAHPSLSATIAQNGQVDVTGVGNGLANITFSISGYETITLNAQVKILLDEKTAYPVAVKLYKDEARTLVCTEGEELSISEYGGKIQVYPQLVMSDGSLLNPMRTQYTLSATLTTNLQGASLATTLVQVNQNGVLRAVKQGNGYVNVTLTLKGNTGTSTWVRVKVTNNIPTPMGMDIEYYDDLHPGGTDYSADNPPQIREKGGYVLLVPKVAFTTGMMDTAAGVGLDVSWEITKTTDLNGNETKSTIASLYNGMVYATGVDDGIVYVRCQLKDYPQFSLDVKIEIRGNGDAYVKSVEVLDSHGLAYGRNSESLTDYGVVQFYARVTYSDGTVKSTFWGNYIEGLEWVSDTQNEFSLDADSGQMVTTAQFESTRVKAVVRGGGFYGQDISSLYVYVFYDPGTSREEDHHSDTLTMKVVYESDYEKSGNKAEAVYEKTFSASELASSAQFYKFTFSKGRSEITGKFARRDYGVLFAEGVSLESLLNDVGATKDNMVAMRFSTADNYNPKAFSYEEIFAQRFSFPNFTLNIDSGNPSSSGAIAVPAILALNSYIHYGGDINDTVYDSSKMSNATQFRLCIGLRSTLDSNSFESAKYVSAVTVIVKDGSYSDYYLDNPDNKKTGGNGEKGNTGGGGGGGLGDGNGTGAGSGGGTGEGAGEGAGDGAGESEGAGDGEASDAEGAGDGDSSGDGAGRGYAQEIRSLLNDDGYGLENVSYVSFVTLMILVCVGAVAVGAVQMGIGYARRRSDGKNTVVQNFADKKPSTNDKTEAEMRSL